MYPGFKKRDFIYCAIDFNKSVVEKLFGKHTEMELYKFSIP